MCTIRFLVKYVGSICFLLILAYAWAFSARANDPPADKVSTGVELVGRSADDPALGAWFAYDAKTKGEVARSYRWGSLALPPGEYLIRLQPKLTDFKVDWTQVQVSEGKVVRVEIKSGIELVRGTKPDPKLISWHVYDAKTNKELARGSGWGFMPLPAGDYNVTLHTDLNVVDVSWGKTQVADSKVSKLEIKSGIELAGEPKPNSLEAPWRVYEVKSKQEVARGRKMGFFPISPGDYDIRSAPDRFHWEPSLGQVQVVEGKVAVVSQTVEDAIAKWTPEPKALETLARHLAKIAKSEPDGIEFGGRLFATGEEVEIVNLPAQAQFTTELHLFSVQPSQFITTNREVGKVVKLGKFTAGTELVFGILVRSTKHTFKIGPGARNPDWLVHAAVVPLKAGGVVVGFEDIYAGGDKDYDDHVFMFRGVASTPKARPKAEEKPLIVDRPKPKEITPATLAVRFQGKELPSVLVPAMELVLDCSGSMKDPVEGQAKYLMARRIMQEVLDELPDDFHLGLRVFGHMGFWGLGKDKKPGYPADDDPRWNTDSELVIAIGALHEKNRRKLIKNWVNFVQPAGATPLVYSLLQAKKDLSTSWPGPKMVIVVTDGMETCGGKLEDVAAAYRNGDMELVVNIVGFGVPAAEEKQLKEIARQAESKYYDARSARQLAEALKESVQTAYVVLDEQGKSEVTRGQVNGNPLSLKPGRYLVRLMGIKSAPVAVEVREAQTVELALDNEGHLQRPEK